MALRTVVLLAAVLACAGMNAGEPLFRLPTANRAIFESGGEPRYFAPTVGKTWASGTFGCVRTDGHQLHEGIDILHLQRDSRGEPTDPIMAVADGTVGYINLKSGLSNYGIYVVIRHSVDGLAVHSLYAHLRGVRDGLKVGDRVNAGEVFATLGRTTNTRSPIGKDRAHLHLEFTFQVSPRYAQWHAIHKAGERNDHGNWNGQNLIGVDPWQLYREQQRLGARFDLARWLRGETEVCRVLVKAVDFPWMRANPALVRPNPRAQKEGVAGVELALNYMGLPFECTPRAASELKSTAPNQVLYVNPAEAAEHHCRRWVTQRGGRWELTPMGLNRVSLLTY